MGDRGNVYIKGEDGGVCLTTQWGGSNLLSVVWDDLRRPGALPYHGIALRLRGLIYHRMLLLGDGPPTGVGISARAVGHDHAVVYIDCVEQVIGLADIPREPGEDQPVPQEFVPFRDFCRMTEEEVRHWQADEDEYYRGD